MLARREPRPLGHQTGFTFVERLLGGKVQRVGWVQPVIRAADKAAHNELSEGSGRGAGAAQSKASASIGMPGCRPGGAPLQNAKVDLGKNKTILRARYARLLECCRASSSMRIGSLTGVTRVPGDKHTFFLSAASRTQL